jgi:hypothetical protein
MAQKTQDRPATPDMQTAIALLLQGTFITDSPKG